MEVKLPGQLLMGERGQGPDRGLLVSCHHTGGSLESQGEGEGAVRGDWGT